MGGQERGRLSKSGIRKIAKRIESALKSVRLKEWQKACKGFAPIHYKAQTRKQWLASNIFRLDAAREIVGFVDSWTTKLKQEDSFKPCSITAIRNIIILAVRSRQEKLGMDLGKLNPVKLGGFRTLIKWADNRDLLADRSTKAIKPHSNFK